MELHHLILKNLHYNEEFCRKALPFIKDEYFYDNSEKVLFNEILDFVTNYRTLPTYESLLIQLNEKNLNETEYNATVQLCETLHDSQQETVDNEWLFSKTETFCQERAIHNAVLESIVILDNKHSNLSKGAIPKLLSEALSVSFDSNVCHDYFGDSESRYEYYHKIEERVPFKLKYFNLITNNGLPRKTLNVILAPPHGGKSLMMCSLAADFVEQGKNVLYITLEMAEEEIAKRIDSNLLKIGMDELMVMDRSVFEKRINYVKSKTIGKFFIKEYPTASANVNHFRALLNELKVKKNFVPDVVFVDYLNICTSSRTKMSGSVNSYTYIKSIGEELRGFAQEYNIPIMTATQTTRGAASSSDIDMTDVSESFGISAIADFMVAIINSDELFELGQIMVKQLKNRYRDLNLNKRFVVGVDRAKMTLYDVESSAQDGITDSGQQIDSNIQDQYKSKFGNSNKKSFDGLKV